MYKQIDKVKASTIYSYSLFCMLKKKLKICKNFNNILVATIVAEICVHFRDFTCNSESSCETLHF